MWVGGHTHTETGVCMFHRLHLYRQPKSREPCAVLLTHM